MQPAQLAQSLGRGIKPLYVLYGDEVLLQQEAADQIRQVAKQQGYTERSVFTVQGAHFKWGEVMQAGSERSLFADQQLIELRIPSGKPGKDGGLALQKLALAAASTDGVVWLVTLGKLDFASQKTAWFTALMGAGTCMKFDPIERRALPAWIDERLKLAGLSVASGDEGARTLQFFADRVEGNLLAAHQEVSKLALLYAGPQPSPLSFEQVEQSVLDVARFDVFKLSEAVLGGQPLRVQRMLDGLRSEGVAEVLVHYTLSEDVRALRRVKQAVAQGKAVGLALRENRVWGTKEQLYERVLPRLSVAFLNELLATAQAVDGIVKGLKHPGLPTQGFAALHHLALTLTQACMAKK